MGIHLSFSTLPEANELRDVRLVWWGWTLQVSRGQRMLSLHTLDLLQRTATRAACSKPCLSNIGWRENGRKGQKSPNHLSKHLSGFVLSMNMFDMSVCLQVLSPHVCTRLLTFTVYSWLGCEPGALQSRAASPHRFRTLTTRGLALC